MHQDNNTLRDKLYFNVLYELKTELLTWFLQPVLCRRSKKVFAILF